MTVRPIRTKSRWFNRAKARDPETLAGVAAFTAWRLGLNTIKRMRSAHFEIEASPPYFAFLAEYLVFLIQVADRFAYLNLALEGKVEEVLVGGLCKQSDQEGTGRTRSNKIVNFPGNLNLVGNLIPVHITKAYPHSLRGERILKNAECEIEIQK